MSDLLLCLQYPQVAIAIEIWGKEINTIRRKQGLSLATITLRLTFSQMQPYHHGILPPKVPDGVQAGAVPEVSGHLQEVLLLRVQEGSAAAQRRDLQRQPEEGLRLTGRRHCLLDRVCHRSVAFEAQPS